MIKKMSFDKKTKEWELVKFYLIYMKDSIKTIKFFGMIDKEDRGKNYLSWICIEYNKEFEMPLEEFLAWGVYYQFDYLESFYPPTETELPPYKCFERANEWVLADGNGSYFKKLLDLNENTPCGYYYGY